MGKKKLELKRIQNPVSRHGTFYKRKGGLLKKAFELSGLCDAEVALIIFSETGKIYEFASHDESVTTIMAKYRTHKKTTRNNSSPSSLQNTKFDQLQFKGLDEKIGILKKRNKNMVGKDLESLTMKELEQLEKQIEKSIRRTCDRKMKLFSQSFKLLVEKVRSLEEENTELHTKLSTTGDSSTSAPKPHLHLGLPYNTVSSGLSDGNKDGHSTSELQ